MIRAVLIEDDAELLADVRAMVERGKRVQVVATFGGVKAALAGEIGRASGRERV